MTILRTPLNITTYDKTPRSKATTVKNISIPKLRTTPAPKLQKPRRRKINKEVEIKVFSRKVFICIDHFLLNFFFYLGRD